MSSLVNTIDQTLASIGSVPRNLLLETLQAFEYMALPDEERLSAIATALASSAVAHHGRHVGKFIDAVRIWALEAVPTASPLSSIRFEPEPGAVSEAAEILASGLDALLVALKRADVPLQTRAIAELTLFTRLLGPHDVHTILQVLGAAAEAVAELGYVRGDLVEIGLTVSLAPTRNADLAQLRTQGTA